jgi:hypothetical protein
MIVSLRRPIEISARAPFHVLRGKAYNLRQIQRVIADGVEDQVLQPVDYVEKFISKCSHDRESVRGQMCAVVVFP